MVSLLVAASGMGVYAGGGQGFSNPVRLWVSCVGRRHLGLEAGESSDGDDLGFASEEDLSDHENVQDWEADWESGEEAWGEGSEGGEWREGEEVSAGLPLVEDLEAEAAEGGPPDLGEVEEKGEENEERPEDEGRRPRKRKRE